MPLQRRGPWAAHEDEQLLTLAQSHGPHNWVRISQLIGTRTPKQCRERFHQNLKPQLNHDPISPEEGALIERLVGEKGKRWAEIARRLEGRSDNAVKNWWNGGMNRRRRVCLRQRLDADRHQDERRQGLESISPFSARPLGQDGMGMRTLRPIAQPLPSPPSFLSRSRGHSKEPTPSLTSDNMSSNSQSPRLSVSPVVAANTLPPLLISQYQFHHHHTQPQHYDFSNSRRSSVSIISSNESVAAYADTYYNHHSRNYTFEPAVEKDLPSPSYFSLQSSEGPQYHYLRHRPPHPEHSHYLPPVTPIRDSFSNTSQLPSPSTTPRDGRMQLASILG